MEIALSRSGIDPFWNTAADRIQAPPSPHNAGDSLSYIWEEKILDRWIGFMSGWLRR